MTKTAEQVVAEAFARVRDPEYRISEEEDFSDARIAVAALREVGMLVETEWEYGAMWPDACTGEPSIWGNDEMHIRSRLLPGMVMVRRRKAGSWEEMSDDC